ncbi:MAG TPA: NAD(P)H-dependent oxidoreductase [Polyangiaceae bacterium]|nr:NAD(P)H-dependent oxidoreductase [Polyangiaceae bacterium]
MFKLQVIAVSTREGRAGLPLVQWFSSRAMAHGGFDVELVDLKDVALPMFDEPAHPRLKKYRGEHTKAWSARVDAADAFVFVMPEYNHGAPPSLINALDYLSSEWAYKACGFVSYGGLSGGTRGVVHAKQVLSAMKMVPLVESVAFPFFNKLFREDGSFDGSQQEAAAKTMLDELVRWTQALTTLRAPRG